MNTLRVLRRNISQWSTGGTSLWLDRERDAFLETERVGGEQERTQTHVVEVASCEGDFPEDPASVSPSPPADCEGDWGVVGIPRL